MRTGRCGRWIRSTAAKSRRVTPTRWRRRNRLRRVRHRALLRRLPSCAGVGGRDLVHVPVRGGGAFPARGVAARRGRARGRSRTGVVAAAWIATASCVARRMRRSGMSRCTWWEAEWRRAGLH
jgi:hypothetical protein